MPAHTHSHRHTGLGHSPSSSLPARSRRARPCHHIPSLLAVRAAPNTTKKKQQSLLLACPPASSTHTHTRNKSNNQPPKALQHSHCMDQQQQAAPPAPSITTLNTNNNNMAPGFPSPPFGHPAASLYGMNFPQGPPGGAPNMHAMFGAGGPGIGGMLDPFNPHGAPHHLHQLHHNLNGGAGGGGGGGGGGGSGGGRLRPTVGGPMVSSGPLVGGTEKRRAVRKWRPQEDELLTALVREYGTKHWGIICTKFEGRTGKQCRERWHNQVRVLPPSLPPSLVGSPYHNTLTPSLPPSHPPTLVGPSHQEGGLEQGGGGFAVESAPAVWESLGGDREGPARAHG